jgi:hypothetical protein
MKKNGLTVVELIVSFTLTMTIIIFLMQIIINLTKMYNNNSKKTELLNKQSLISDEINSNFIEKNLISIEKCEEENCYNFNYATAETDKLIISNNILKFGSLAIQLDDATYGDITLDVIYTPTLQSQSKNSIFILNIPINSNIDYNFDIKILYQFNMDDSLIDEYFTS